MLRTYSVFQVVDVSDLESDLKHWHDAIDDVEDLEAFNVLVEGPRDDGEDHVEEGEDGAEAKEVHVQVHLDGDVATR